MDGIWHPLGDLPTVTSMVEEQLADVERMTDMLEEARDKPHVLDAATLDRVIRVYGEAVEVAALHAEQVRRWRSEGPDVEQSRQLDRLQRQIDRYSDGARSLVDLARELKGGCIDTIMAMSDEQIALAVMTGQLKPPMAEAPRDERPDNVTQLPVPLTVNERFLHAFLDEQPPCAAVGLVEEARDVKGFVAVQAETHLSLAQSRPGGTFGVGVLGNDRYQILHFMLVLPGLEPIDILLNPSNQIVGKVVDVMRQTGEYFFFVVEQGSLMAFHNHMDSSSREWFDRYGDIVHTATTTSEQYEAGVRGLVAGGDMLHGKLLNWVCRDEPSSIDLIEDRLQIRSSGS